VTCGSKNQFSAARLLSLDLGGAWASFQQLPRTRPRSRRGRSIADSPGVVAAWRDALDLSNDERDGMRAALFHGAVVVGSHAGVWSELSVAARKRAAASPAFRLGLDAYRGRWRDRVEAAERDVAALAADGIGLNPAPLVTGEDLIVMGLAPGPRFKSILDQVYDAQLEGRVKNLQEGRELARTIGV
jgi:hypothetical protein